MNKSILNIGTESVVYTLSASNSPAAFCSSGDTVRFETMDCFANQIKDDSGPFDYADWSKTNPATGPLYIQGAEPGDILKIEIISIELADNALVMEFPGDGITGKNASAETAKLLPKEENAIRFSSSLTLPLHPMIGVIGTAPADGAILTNTPGPHGGNLDCKEISTGCCLYLPVNVEGALLALGDLHAAMGDGEVCVCGAEIAGAVTLRVSIIKGERLPLPLLVTEDKCICIASASSLDAAAEASVCSMRRLLTEKAGMKENEAGMLMSLAGDLRICQAVNPLKTCRMELALNMLDKLR